MIPPSSKRFGEALIDLLREDDLYVTSTGKVNLRAFAQELEGCPYHSLRRAVVGDRPATVELMEECARALRVRPDYFADYREAKVREGSPAAA